MLLKGVDNETLVRSSRSVAPEARIVAVADDAAHEQRLRDAGADFVIAPHTLVAEELAFVTSNVLANGTDVAGLDRRAVFKQPAEVPLKNVA